MCVFLSFWVNGVPVCQDVSFVEGKRGFGSLQPVYINTVCDKAFVFAINLILWWIDMRHKVSEMQSSYPHKNSDLFTIASKLVGLKENVNFIYLNLFLKYGILFIFKPYYYNLFKFCNNFLKCHILKANFFKIIFPFDIYLYLTIFSTIISAQTALVCVSILWLDFIEIA